MRVQCWVFLCSFLLNYLNVTVVVCVENLADDEVKVKHDDGMFIFKTRQCRDICITLVLPAKDCIPGFFMVRVKR